MSAFKERGRTTVMVRWLILLGFLVASVLAWLAIDGPIPWYPASSVLIVLWIEAAHLCSVEVARVLLGPAYGGLFLLLACLSGLGSKRIWIAALAVLSLGANLLNCFWLVHYGGFLTALAYGLLPVLFTTAVAFLSCKFRTDFWRILLVLNLVLLIAFYGFPNIGELP